jgi:soluble lytic murein transglycosylase
LQYLIRRFALAAVLFCLNGVAVAAPDSSTQTLSDQRRAYVEADQALRRGNAAQFARLRAGLNDYPLALYLDYEQLSRRVTRVSGADATAFITRSADTPLANRFVGKYLRAAGKDQRWDDFLQARSEVPNSGDLKCYFFRAQLAQGNKDLAWEGAAALWVEGKSQPSACDPLFAAWQRDGQLTDAIVWTRLLNAFEAREEGLLQYVAKKSSADMRPSVEQLLAVYKQPETVTRRALGSDIPYATDIATRGLAQFARYNPEEALSQWDALQAQLPFTPEQTRQVESAIALQSLFARTSSNTQWLDAALASLQDDKLVGIRLRWALSEQDWDAFESTLPLLSETAQQENVWRYWRAMILQRAGDKDASIAALQQVAGERDYYGFLAADKLGQAYSLNHQKFVLSDASAVMELPAVARIEELKFHGKDMLAHSEWYTLLQNTQDTTRQQDLAIMATQKGWYRMAIDAASRAQAWDALDQRFPTPYQDVFQKNAAARNVPSTELMSIARRESAFFAGAQSPVGARGLMQVMPATGKAVAASLSKQHNQSDLFDLEHNIALGSAYYRQMLDRFGGNRIFALTAYNAGPHRVDRWRNTAGDGLSVEFWVETIPYYETRNYVQAVLSYNVIFQYMQGEQQVLLTPLEREASY